jgi:Ca2+-binding RTX toxin-like protein
VLDVTGGSGNDTFFGSSGNDTFSGGGGNDTLSGNAGSDTFLFRPGDGHDRVSSFGDTAGDQDIIDLRGVFASFEAVMAATQQVGNDTVITVNEATSISLVSFSPSGLTPDDFRF